MKSSKVEKKQTFPITFLENSKDAQNQCVFSNDKFGAWLYHANCIEFMDELIPKYPDGKFDMIFADPPYFLSNGGITCHAGKMTKVDKGQWDKSNGQKINHEFNLKWLSKCQKLLKPNGTIWVSGTHHVIYSVGYAMQQLGMKILNNITWEKPNPPPNLSCRYFTHSTEQIIWARKNEKVPHFFNYELMKELNEGTQMKDVWKLPAISPWEKSCSKHPTQKPLSVLTRLILASTEQNAWILDPFTGSSTTGIAANLLNRRFLGIDIEQEYLEISKNRKLEIENHNISSLYKSKIQGFQKEKQLELFIASEPKVEYGNDLKI